jgi:hypothetical protein
MYPRAACSARGKARRLRRSGSPWPPSSLAVGRSGTPALHTGGRNAATVSAHDRQPGIPSTVEFATVEKGHDQTVTLLVTSSPVTMGGASELVLPPTLETNPESGCGPGCCRRGRPGGGADRSSARKEEQPRFHWPQSGWSSARRSATSRYDYASQATPSPSRSKSYSSGAIIHRQLRWHRRPGMRRSHEQGHEPAALSLRLLG